MAINFKGAIAKALKLTVDKIKKVAEWAHVYFVQLSAGKPIFVSKKVVKKLTKTITKKINARHLTQHLKEFNFTCALWEDKNYKRLYIRQYAGISVRSYGYIDLIHGEVQIKPSWLLELITNFLSI